ncbi:hypothetical protein PPO43_11890 [Saprospira sp. CCB-QB6]|uniref:MbnP family protein n=1 Tax=Saprospira sp. CCB-QB6 TaxID=3023936 RepID=UPI00234B8BF3|nr:MbnP family protein [Saprospira sp. CCB-QB6]WCL80670.1 hypothetical protein PPO43_11890 [Saprospira sp. CCB-QB6]
MKYLFAALGLLFLATACDLEEGCTDPTAENYAPEADTDCCCEYFGLRLNRSGLWADTSSFSWSSKYPDMQGDSFQLEQFRFFVSSFALRDHDGQWWRVQDSLLYPLANGSSRYLASDIAIWRNNSFLYDLGRFDQAREFDRLRFLVGADPNWSDLAPSQIESSLALSSNFTASLYENGTYRSAEMQAVLGLDSSQYVLSDTVWVELPLALSGSFDENLSLSLALDYSDLLRGVAFNRDDSSQIVQQIRQNMANAFQIP